MRKENGWKTATNTTDETHTKTVDTQTGSFTHKKRHTIQKKLTYILILHFTCPLDANCLLLLLCSIVDARWIGLNGLLLVWQASDCVNWQFSFRCQKKTKSPKATKRSKNPKSRRERVRGSGTQNIQVVCWSDAEWSFHYHLVWWLASLHTVHTKYRKFNYQKWLLSLIQMRLQSTGLHLR